MAKHLIFKDDKILFRANGDTLAIPSEGQQPVSFRFHSPYGECAVSYAEADFITPVGFKAVALREAYPLLCEADYSLAAKGLELANWERATRFCSRCGARLEWHTEISKCCTACAHEYFPQLSPAVIVLVRKGNSALLVHARTFKRPFFGLVAGFVETGETIEQTVAREVMEETSLKIKNIRYAGSQSWPYPATLMLGFTADYESGELKFADGELTEGGFFTADSLPPLATPPSIARRLIDEWVKEQQSR